MPDTEQAAFWRSKFGDEYTDRNIYSTEELDEFYKKTYNVTATDMYQESLRGLSISSCLEVGSNVGNQLKLLQKLGYQNLYGVEINAYAVQKAKELTKNINIIEGSAFDIPFKDGYFDLVFTAGVLIHIHPDDLRRVMKEIYRVSKKYIRGFEYFSPRYTEINYRGNLNRLWKANFADIYLQEFPALKLVWRKSYKYVDTENVDEAFLLEKTI